MSAGIYYDRLRPLAEYRRLQRWRAFAAMTEAMDDGFTHFQDTDGSVVKLTDLIEHDLCDAPRLSVKEAKAVARLHCQRCAKRLSRKTAPLIDGKLLCSTCMFAPPLRDSGRLPKGENAEGG